MINLGIYFTDQAIGNKNVRVRLYWRLWMCILYRVGRELSNHTNTAQPRRLQSCSKCVSYRSKRQANIKEDEFSGTNSQPYPIRVQIPIVSWRMTYGTERRKS